MMVTNHSMDHDTRANHIAEPQEAQALWTFVCISILWENVWEQTKYVLNSAFLIFEKILNKMAHVFALCFTDQFAPRLI